jgi:hypothetical protein
MVHWFVAAPRALLLADPESGIVHGDAGLCLGTGSKAWPSLLV